MGIRPLSLYIRYREPPEAPPREQEEYVQEEVTDWDPLRPASEWKDRELQDYICWMDDKPMRHFLNTAWKMVKNDFSWA